MKIGSTTVTIDGDTVKIIGTKSNSWREEWYFYVNEDKETVMYTNNKNLKITGYADWDD